MKQQEFSISIDRADLLDPGGDQISTAFLLTDRRGVSCKFSQNSIGGIPKSAAKQKIILKSHCVPTTFQSIHRENFAKQFHICE